MKYTKNSSNKNISKRITIKPAGKIVQDQKKRRNTDTESATIQKDIIESIDAPIFSLDRNLHYTSFNSRHAADMKLYNNVQIKLGDDFLEDINNETDKKLAQHNMEKVLQDGECYITEMYYGGSSTAAVYSEIIHSPVKNSRGEITGISVIVLDKTEKKILDDIIQKQRTEYRNIIDAVPSLIILSSRDNKVIRINKMAATLLEKHPREIVGHSINEVFHESSMKLIAGLSKQVLDTGQPVLDIKSKHCLITGHEMFSQTDILPYVDNKGNIVGIIYVITDITERQNATEQLLTLNRLYNFLSEINQSIVRNSNFEDLFHSLCYLAVKTAGFKMAWIGLINEKTGHIEPVAYYGSENGFLNTISDSNSDQLHPISSAIHISEGKVTVIEDIKQDIRMAKWKDEALKKGYQSLASIPLKPHDKFAGNFVIYSDKCEAFKYKEINLLEQVGIDISFAMERIDFEMQHKHTEKNLRLLAELLNNANDSVLVFKEDKKVVYVNDTTLKMYGYTRNEFIRIGPQQMVVPKFITREQNAAQELITKGEIHFETAHYRKNGSIMPLEIRAKKLEIEGNIYIIGIASDITRRKKTEEKLKFRLKILNAATDTIIVWNENDDYIYANDAACRSSGYTHKELTGKNIKDLVPQKTYRFLMSHVENELKTKGVSIFQVDQISKDKKKTPGEVHTRLIRLGTQKYKVSITRDITERVEARHKLEERSKQLEKTFEGITQAIAATVEMRDPYTAGHQIRVARLAEAIALEMDLPKDKAKQIFTAGLIHDIGKLSLPAELLSKPGRLSNIEFSLISTHPRAGYEILKSIDFTYPLAQWVLEHHERINGSGYPAKLSGAKISLEARILAVADVVEAMSSHRPYRPSLGINAAIEEISQKKNILYDGIAVDACIRLFKEKDFNFN